MQHDLRASASACANIALAKYWGKSDTVANLPAVPSISLTLDELVTETEVSFEPDLGRRRLHFGRSRASARRTVASRDGFARQSPRSDAGIEYSARVESKNLFPTGAGLASSASGFAALAAAATRAARLEASSTELSALARRSSASAARSVFGGFVELPAGVPGDDWLAAYPLAPERHWDVRLDRGDHGQEARSPWAPRRPWSARGRRRRTTGNGSGRRPSGPTK